MKLRKLFGLPEKAEDEDVSDEEEERRRKEAEAEAARKPFSAHATGRHVGMQVNRRRRMMKEAEEY